MVARYFSDSSGINVDSEMCKSANLPMNLQRNGTTSVGGAVNLSRADSMSLSLGLSKRYSSVTAINDNVNAPRYD